MRIIFILLVLLFTLSCSDDIQEVNKYEEEIAFLDQQGYNVSDIVAVDGYFGFDKDMVIAIHHVRKAMNEPTFTGELHERQQREAFTVRGCETRDLKYYVSDDLKDDWDLIVFDNPFGAYDNISSNLNFTSTSIYTQADVKVLSDDDTRLPTILQSLPSATIMQAEIPGSDNKVGEFISVNSDNVCIADPATDGLGLSNTLLHEIGHTVGLAHFNDGTHIPFTPTTDNASVMNTPGVCPNTQFLSAGDIDAIEIFFPEQIVITGPAGGSSQPSSFTGGLFSAGGAKTYDTVLWTASTSNGTLNVQSPTNPSFTNITGFKPNSYNTISLAHYCGGALVSSKSYSLYVSQY